MPRHEDQPMYRTFEEFEREELRRAEAVGGSVDDLFDGMFVDDLIADDGGSTRSLRAYDGDDEEE